MRQRSSGIIPRQPKIIAMSMPHPRVSEPHPRIEAHLVTQSAPATGRIASMSTYDTSCGIATYSQALVDALDKEMPGTIDVHAAHNRSVLNESTRPYRRTWTTDGIYDINVEDYDVVHIQHEFGLHTNHGALMKLLDRCKHVVLTAHTVVDGQHNFFKELARRGVTVICHSQAQLDKLIHASVDCSNTILIPHGTHLRTIIDKHTARVKLGLPWDATIGLTLGYITPNKNIAQAVVRIKETNTQFEYYIVGTTTGNNGYRNDILKYANDDPRIHLVEKYIEDKDNGPRSDLAMWYSAADFAIIDCNDSVSYSASGRIHYALGFGTPILCGTAPILSEMDASNSAKFHDAASFKLQLAAITGCTEYRELLRQQSLKLAEESSWQSVAKQTKAVYDKLLVGGVK